MFYFIKKASGDFWHRFDNNTKEVNLSEWQIILDLVAQTVVLQTLNGANIPANSVGILDVIVIDETDASVEEPFVSVTALRTRLIALGYNPYITTTGGATYIEAGTNVSITGTGTLSDPYVISSSGGGATPDLQEVLTAGGTVIEGANELYLDVAGAVFSYGTAETALIASDGIPLELAKINQSDTDKIGIVRILETSEIELSQESGGQSTKITIEEPTATTEWQVPAESAGTYNFASEEYVTAELANRIKVLARSGTSGSPITGTTAETQVLQLFIPANTLTTSDWITVGRLNFNKTTNVSTCTVRVKISTSATLPSGTTGRMATYTSSSSIQGFGIMRKFWQDGGNLKGVNDGISYLNDAATATSGTSASRTFDPTVDNYLYVSVQNTSASESIFLESYEITN